MASKITRLPISLPKGINLDVSHDSKYITIKSASVSLVYPFHPSVKLVKSEDSILFESDSTSRNRTVRSVSGTIYASIKRAIQDIQHKFTVKVQLKGVGYKAVFANHIITLSLGFSHLVKIAVPKEIDVKITQNTLLEIAGYDRRKVMDIAVSIRNLRKPEPYKGKGVFIDDETISIKEGKKK